MITAVMESMQSISSIYYRIGEESRKINRYIDADAFAEKMERKYCESCDKYQGIRCNKCSCGDWLDALYFEQASDVRENVKAEWKIEYTGDGWNDYIDVTCTNCGKTIEHGEPFNFCPNCGADMRGGKHEQIHRR